VVRKTRIGAFSTTDLEQQLNDRGITTLSALRFGPLALVQPVLALEARPGTQQPPRLI
jgi:hypothetical protein